MTIEDIRNINHIYYTSFKQNIRNPHSLFTCYVLFFMRLVKHVICLRFSCKDIGKILFFIPSSNNKKAVKTILDELSIKEISIFDKSENNFPLARFYISSLRGLFLFQKLYNASSNEDKLLIRQFYVSFMCTYGIYKCLVQIIKDNPQLKLIVLANDHLNYSRCLIEIAELYGVKTLYVQHASITERFPPLHFTYSFLDGMESYVKYRNIGDMHGKVFLSGSPRFDELYSYNKSEKEYEIGIALNMLDSCESVIDLCKYLLGNVSKKIIVRPHPLMGKLFDGNAFQRLGVDISAPTNESSFAFLSRIKFLVANESSIHLDSALMHVPSLLYNFSNCEVRDWYSYIKNGIIKVCVNKEEVVKMLRLQEALPVEKIRYYNASFQTPIEGRVGALVANFVTRLLEGSEEDAMSYINSVMCDNGDFFDIRQ